MRARVHGRRDGREDRARRVVMSGDVLVHHTCLGDVKRRARQRGHHTPDHRRCKARSK